MRRILEDIPPLCLENGCLRLVGHQGKCSTTPAEAWAFMKDKDKEKLSKAGYATPRGGAKGAYQNHVYRNSRVIIPYEKLALVPDISIYKNDYVIRVLPEQCFEIAGKLKSEFSLLNSKVIIGNNAFVLYRSHDIFEKFPPLTDWHVRYLEKPDGTQIDRRVKDAMDRGHYILRLPKVGGGKTITKPERIEGLPQGIFAPEYADADTNFLCQIVLAWQIIHTVDSPYLTSQAIHIQAILNSLSLLEYQVYENRGIINNTFTSCPLCLRPIRYGELHEMLRLEEESGLMNAAEQIEGATRSTIVNLFHFHPLVYEQLEHIPQHVAWGHATCNTKLGQRRCYTLQELMDMNNKVGVLHGEQFKSFGWISDNQEMIRSPGGAVWIQITIDALNLEPS